VQTFALACPNVSAVQSMDNNPVTVSFDPPVASGGVAPVTTTCSATSPTSFPVGANTVTCTGLDARGVSAGCSFTVTVHPPPRLVGARFVAFGDSITFGTDSPPIRTASPSFAYPEQLQLKLAARYRFQTPQVVNEGVPGEHAHTEGALRIRSVLQRHRPDILLLMEGTNDLLVPLGVERGIAGLRQIVQEAKLLNIRVAIATVPPQRLNGPKNRPVNVVLSVPVLNDQIRALAAAENLILVDVYDKMKDNMSLIGEDDLHPTRAGFEVIAGIFYDAIVANFEVKPAALSWSGR
jgi:lysophospholipase L1-like esterase